MFKWFCPAAEIAMRKTDTDSGAPTFNIRFVTTCTMGEQRISCLGFKIDVLIKMGPRRDTNFSFAASLADELDAGYSPPTLHKVKLQSSPFRRKISAPNSSNSTSKGQAPEIITISCV